MSLPILNDPKFIIILSGLTSWLVAMILLPLFIHWQKKRALGQFIHEMVPSDHQSKQGTPIMGGLPIYCAVILNCALWLNIQSSTVWVPLLAYTFFSLIGGIDDGLILFKKKNEGLSRRAKMLLAIASASCIVALLHHFHPMTLQGTWVPFLQYWLKTGLVLGITITLLALIGTANAVNLTDGLDGLVTVPLILLASALGLTLAFYQPPLSNYDLINTGVILSSFIGALLAFLWFNSYPASIFMGDIGALGSGALLAVLASMHGLTLWLIIAGGLFVIEALSVILQISSFRLRNKKRIFKMAPIHHHFELLGWHETKVVIRFWIIAFIFSVLAVSSLL